MDFVLFFFAPIAVILVVAGILLFLAHKVLDVSLRRMLKEPLIEYTGYRLLSFLVAVSVTVFGAALFMSGYLSIQNERDYGYNLAYMDAEEAQLQIPQALEGVDVPVLLEKVKAFRLEHKYGQDESCGADKLFLPLLESQLSLSQYRDFSTSDFSVWYQVRCEMASSLDRMRSNIRGLDKNVPVAMRAARWYSALIDSRIAGPQAAHAVSATESAILRKRLARIGL